MEQIKRTLKEAIDLDTMKVISIDDLIDSMNAGTEKYDYIRHEATGRSQANNPRYVCAKCGHSVYAPLEPSKKLPYWQHFKGAPTDCIWWTGNNHTIDEVSARQFQGAQESPLHLKIKTHVAECLNLDENASEIKIEEYIFDENKDKRKPDVQAVWQEKRIVFEIQLATTQIPIILARESFYKEQGIPLIWFVWNFEECELIDMNQSIRDIYRRHYNNLFSIDTETMALSIENNKLMFRVFANGYDGWHNRIFSLDDIDFCKVGSPQGFWVPISVGQKLRQEWIEATDEEGTCRHARENVFNSLNNECQLNADYYDDFMNRDIHTLINMILSLECGRPIGTHQKNIVEFANTFLAGAERHRYVQIFKLFAKWFKHDDLLNRKSVQKKIELAMQEEQITKGSIPSKIIRFLFDDWIEYHSKK